MSMGICCWLAGQGLGFLMDGLDLEFLTYDGEKMLISLGSLSTLGRAGPSRVEASQEPPSGPEYMSLG
jgi:hypothetical protein